MNQIEAEIQRIDLRCAVLQKKYTKHLNLKYGIYAIAALFFLLAAIFRSKGSLSLLFSVLFFAGAFAAWLVPKGRLEFGEMAELSEHRLQLEQLREEAEKTAMPAETVSKKLNAILQSDARAFSGADSKLP